MFAECLCNNCQCAPGIIAFVPFLASIGAFLVCALVMAFMFRGD